MVPVNVVSQVPGGQWEVIRLILSKVFQAVIDFLFSIVETLINFFTTPQVLWALVTIAIIYGAWRMLKRKGTSL